MALNNTINFLPGAFRTSTNQRFLGATLDQLYTQAVNVPINGYIGRTFAPTYKLQDNYVPELDTARKHYQLEPSITIKDDNNNVTFSSGYLDLLKSIANSNGITNNHQRLFSAEAYSFNGHFDFDKFVRYYDYYWLPSGPDAVNVFAGSVPLQNTFTVTKNTDIGGYVFSGVGTHPNLQLTLARGGTYKFVVDQPGSKFWIQTQSGVSGTDSNVSTVSTRQIFGVSNNGDDVGEVIFHVPSANAQDFYIQMPIKASPAAAVSFHYTDIQGQLLSDFLAAHPDGLDGLDTQFNNKTFVFVTSDVDPAFWTVDNVTVPVEDRRSVWRIQLSTLNENDPACRINLIKEVAVLPREKVFIGSGKTYASNQFWLDNNYNYTLVPIITANSDYLFYQDGTNPAFTGQIKIVDTAGSTIDVDKDITGSVGYTSPNGVKFTNGLKIKFDSSVVPAAYANTEFYVEGVGVAIRLVPVSELEVVEDFGAYITTTPDYITINRASEDRNPWSRYNRWFHVDVIDATATYNNTAANYGPNLPARRPIIEFDRDLQLFNTGKQAKKNIDYITFDATDAFNEVEGQVSATVDGAVLKTGDRVVFAKDYDTNTLNKVYEVVIENINSNNYVTLVETSDDPIFAGQQVLVCGGDVNKAKTFRFTGSEWIECQAKTGVNQAPLYDLIDSNDYSFSDTTVYPGSTFAGTKFFGYTVGTGSNDPVLGFPLKYQTFNNVGDISFTNYYDSDTFTYTLDQTTYTVNANSGYILENDGLAVIDKYNNWTAISGETKQYQVFTKFFDGYVITDNGVEKAFVQVDILPAAQTTVPHTKVYLNNALLTPKTDYNFIKVGIYDVIVLETLPAVGDKIDVLIFSDQASAESFYEIPRNLEYNPLNGNFSSVTLGQIRSHYDKLLENTSVVSSGTIPVQDLYVRDHTGTLMQHSSPLIYAVGFMNNPDINFINGLSLAKKEYTKFKNKFLGLCSSLTNLNYKDPVSGVDTILQTINAVKNSSFPWYYSDMVPQGGNFTSVTYDVLNVRQTTYEISSIFNNHELSNRSILIYLNGVQLIEGTDYVFSTISPSVTFNVTFNFGDVIYIRDYFNTDGNYVPETPTKLGLYPKFKPEIFVDNTYQTPISVIRGHDGSITPAFGDFRDQYILELEKRIYNNIKVDYANNFIDLYDVIPGRFRKTDYSDLEFETILSQSFSEWTGQNNLDYTSNTVYDPNNSWTWNYAKFTDVVDGSYLQGSWRAIYEYWYDTDTPNITPWAMLGISSKPSWWDGRYGAGPYTSGNAVLWEDLESGYIWNDGAPYYDTRFARPGLTSFIPVDNAGNLISPTDVSLVKSANPQQAGKPWSPGEHGPVEIAWRRSGDYPYAIQLAIALSKPAKYFGTQLDIHKFFKNPQTGHFSTIDNKKLSPDTIVVNGDSSSVPGTVLRSSGYINWIVDSLTNQGVAAVDKVNTFLKNMSVQLTCKVGGFTDKNLITVYAEQTTPGSTNASVVVPDANYTLYLDSSVPVNTVTYSAVIVEKTLSGYSVTGYDTSKPFFTIYPSVIDANFQTATINSASAKIYSSASADPVLIPYGTEFTSIQQVADFLISYERFLTKQGFVFTQFDTDLQTERNWTLSVNELLYWSQQGWSANSIIVLNPISSKLNLSTQGSIVGEISNLTNGSKILDQNFLPIKTSNFNIIRTDEPVVGNNFYISTLDGTGICFARFDLIQFEHVLVFDNISEFGDIFYIPTLGTRQNRLKLNGVKTGIWTGALSAPGYMYNDPNIPEWTQGKDYKIGDLVTYNSYYYTATKDMPALLKFDPTLWTKINKSDIKTGLLPSLGHNAQKFENIYDIDKPPVDETLQNFSAGLIGFRPRPYLTDLGISIPTQTKLYQGYIKEKGSLNSITALTKANFNNVTGNINIHEEWAFRVGLYGGVNSNTFTEFVLDQSTFNSNPVAFTFTDNEYSTGNIIVNLSTASNVYNASNVSNVSTNIYGNRANHAYMTDLPSVGYMNAEDVDYSVFDINKFTDPLTKLGSGDKVWVAKDGTGQWDILRVNETDINAVAVTYTLDTFAQLQFNDHHPFVENDALVLKYFDPDFDGVYKVLSVPNLLTVTIEIKNEVALKRLLRGLSLSGNGIVYSLVSAKINSITDLAVNTIPKHGWIENDRVWVDSATTDGWGVYTYTTPWPETGLTHLTANVAQGNDKFGTSVKISSNNNYVYVGNPGNKSVQVFANVAGTLHANVTVSNAIANFGSVVESQGNLLIVGSTTDANVHVYRHWANATVTKLQTIKSANVTAINSISLSSDLKHLYIGDATNNIVEAYYTQTADTFGWVSKHTGPVASKFGSVVKVNSNGTKVFVSAPEATNVFAKAGNVYVYNGNTFATAQATISSQSKNDSALFGYSLDIDATGTNLLIGIPGSSESGQANGALERYALNGSTYNYTQLLTQPTMDIGRFGVSVSVSSDAAVLAVGSQGSSTDEHTYFDEFATIIDSDTTKFVDEIYDSGVTYVFENQIDQSQVGNAGQYVFAHELEAQLSAGDLFGSSVDVSRTLIVAGAPGSNATAGSAYTYNNLLGKLGWTLTRQQQAKVDIDTISRTFIYNKTDNNILAALDFIDPAKGKLLSTIDKDIDFKVIADPAMYNAGTGVVSPDLHWGANQVGKIWWNLDSIRYIDYEQDALIYRLTRWGQTFPGSSVDVYEWVESTTVPSQYTGSGTPLHADDSAYCTSGYVDQGGNIKLKYYFWVSNRDIINTRAGKSNSVVAIANAIESPAEQGIPYATVLRNDSIAMYNVNQLLTGQNSILHLGTQIGEQKLIHSEYALVQEGNTTNPIPAQLINKLNDSLSGIDANGNPVPDPSLPVSQRYGIGNRPVQTMIMRKDDALYNVIYLINNFLAEYPTVIRKPLTLMNSSEPVPAADSGEYDLSVDTFIELSYINPNKLSVGTKVIVLDDVNYSTKWAIYTWNGTAFNSEPRVQSFKTSLYWYYTDWFDSSYDPTSTPDLTVANNLEFGKLTLQPNTYIKVLDDGHGKFLVYHIDSSLKLNLVGIESGTIQVLSNVMPPAKETRQMLLAMKQEIFTDDIASEYNKIFFTIIKYILTEQRNVDWLFKTSFINAIQHIRKLEQFPAYISDNQNFYVDYINEVKPYRTIIREFVVDYERQDQFDGDITDFDLPPYWDSNVNVYRSPSGELSSDAAKLQTGVYSQWANNYAYKVVDTIIERPGTGYLLPPQISFVGGNGKGAEGYAEVNAYGQLSGIVITNPGSGYTSIPTIVINGTGTGAVARAVLRNIFDGNNTGHNVVRSVKTKIKFDRTSYTTSNVFQPWDEVVAGQVIAANTIIRLDEILYKLDQNDYTIDANVEFPIANVTQIGAGDFTSANDRITAFNGNVDLSLYVDGISYPGVIVDGNTAELWTANLVVFPDKLITYGGNLYLTTGNVFDAGGSFANISANVEQVYADSMTKVGINTDSIIQSRFTDALGVDPSDILIDGGAYVDTYESHAPEELVPGQMFDSVNISVFSNVSPTVNDYAFRLFDDLNQGRHFYRIAAANTTTLSQTLHLTDTVVHLTDASVLPQANPDMAIPGVLFVNGEKITYYRNYSHDTVTPWTANLTVTTGSLISYSGNTYVTTGNVYGATFNVVATNAEIIDVNSVTQIRRGVDGTPTLVQAQGSIATDGSRQQVVPNSTVTKSNVGASPATYTVTGNVSYLLTATHAISANIGEFITQVGSSANVRLLETVHNANIVAVVGVGPTTTWNTGNLIVNGVTTIANKVSYNPIGMVNTAGQVTLAANTDIATGEIWYDVGVGTATTGNGLINSHTFASDFLLNSPGYMP